MELRNMSEYKVTASGLNLRVFPSSTIKFVLPKGQIVTKLISDLDSEEQWWKVETVINGKTETGFVRNSFLSAIINEFDLPELSSVILGQKIDLWATYYFIPRFKDNPGSNELLDTDGNSLGVSLSDKDWCNAALEGTVNVKNSQGKTQTFNFAGIGDTSQVNCRAFFPSLSTVERTNKSRFSMSKGKYGDGVDGLKLVPYRSIAVDRSEFPIGTAIFIPAARGITVTLSDGSKAKHDGYFFAADVGGAIKNNHIDIFLGIASINPFVFVKSDENETFEAFVVNDSSIIKKLRVAHTS
jgi:3D (Asp-Asp-Asp) domain-containing protein